MRIIFGIPYVAYINPAMNKASTPQGEKGIPFLIAVDVSGLPGALVAMPRAIEPYLAQWTHVSGFLLYCDMTSTTTSGWAWRLVVNPYAHFPLPQAVDVLTSRFPEGGEISYSFREAVDNAASA